MRRLRIGAGAAAVALGSVFALLAFAAPASAAADTDYAASGLSAAAAAPVVVANDTPGAAKVTLAERNTPPAFSAQANLDGVCEVFELCVFPSVAFGGGTSDFFNADLNWNASRPQIANNDESAFNADPLFTAVICTDPNWGGTCGALAPNTGGDTAPTFVNNSESNLWA